MTDDAATREVERLEALSVGHLLDEVATGVTTPDLAAEVLTLRAVRARERRKTRDTAIVCALVALALAVWTVSR